MNTNIAEVSKAPKPELHGQVDISNEDYHNGPGISKSHLDVIHQSPRHYWDKYINPDREPRAETDAMILGTATHCAILEPDEFDSRYAFMPEGLTRQTKAGKEHYEQLLATGKIVLKADQYINCMRMRDAVHAHPIAAKLFSEGKAEQAFYVRAPVEAIDHSTGEVIESEELLKCKPDWITHNGMLIDVKKTVDASPAGFAKSVANYRYFVQAPFYLDIFERLYGEAPPWFIFVAVEESRPHAIGVYYVEADDLAFGRRHYVKDLQRIIECKRNESWPDYSTQIEPLMLPKWIKNVD